MIAGANKAYWSDKILSTFSLPLIGVLVKLFKEDFVCLGFKGDTAEILSIGIEGLFGICVAF